MMETSSNRVGEYLAMPGKSYQSFAFKMPRRKFSLGLASLAWLTLTDGVWAQKPVSAFEEENKAPPMPLEGQALEVPRIQRLDGSYFEPVHAQGKPLLVYWWSSTCPFCALQSPYMEKFWKEHQSKGLQMIALSVDRKREDAVAYIQKRGYTFPVAWTTYEWRQSFPKPKGLPITLLRAADGKLAYVVKGQMDPEEIEAMAEYL